MLTRCIAVYAVVLALALYCAGLRHPIRVSPTKRLSGRCLVCGENVTQTRGYVVMPCGVECVPCYKIEGVE